jgi:hypothetical protein
MADGHIYLSQRMGKKEAIEYILAQAGEQASTSF